MVKHETWERKKYAKSSRFLRKMIPDAEKRISEFSYNTDFKKYRKRKIKEEVEIVSPKKQRPEKEQWKGKKNKSKRPPGGHYSEKLSVPHGEKILHRDLTLMKATAPIKEVVNGVLSDNRVPINVRARLTSLFVFSLVDPRDTPRESLQEYGIAAEMDVSMERDSDGSDLSDDFVKRPKFETSQSHKKNDNSATQSLSCDDKRVFICQFCQATFSAFNLWKEKEDEDKFSYYSARRGQQNSSDKHFYCQHDGSAKLHSQRKTSRCNNKGRIKVGHQCIAKIIARVNEAMSRFIDEKLAEKIPATVVYDLTKDRFLPKNCPNVQDTKASILTKKWILERGRRKRMARRLHKNDMKAVYMMATQLMESDDSSILLYKPFRNEVVCGPPEIDNLPDSYELFMFAFQTERQREVMNRHCGKILIVDETHGTNQYRYSLLSAMVVDNNRRGWPIAHLITSQSDGPTFTFFFSALKSRLDSEENLRKKAPNDLFDTILSEMKVLINTENENEFNTLKDAFREKYKENESAKKFLDYLESHYFNSKKWAMCYRNFPHAEVNTTGHIESFHSRLKKTYLKRKVNKRLDDLINILFDVEWEDHMTRTREARTGF
ncbi:Acyl-[acyl-carrier-protein]--UDP-N-acetylglucosamine O-acyltransferase [Frankliniella fusca]|uniref:Acyl-[acyl-carrier-protein]--UDP-N-acetylglucosamine O-acyltransferase n=1 Tax=Frankliniella fusca TaxID=407009 RepID=A0AAE1HMJ5_9NEOP|nr:Acyl-[acyl-carrier-protein]--UDP-N-acetylglucosamine O-acyltransferase [Frankliniella fusca]